MRDPNPDRPASIDPQEPRPKNEQITGESTVPGQELSATVSCGERVSESTTAEWVLTGQRYQVLGEIARGGMGAVLRAIDTDLQRPLAIKVMLLKGDAAHEARFLDEARITGQLQHPGIPPVHETGRSADGRLFFAMKLIEGRTLAALLNDRPTPQTDLPRFLKIFEQIAQTLAYAHSQGVIHRDLKPSNVMVGAFGEVQVMDWGLAQRLRSCQAAVQPSHPRSEKGDQATTAALGAAEPEATTEIPSPLEETQAAPLEAARPTGAANRLTKAGTILGTLAYMPPEQARGLIDLLDEHSDVFGLGAILCEVLTGAPPYLGLDQADMLRRAQAADLVEPCQRLTSCGADAELVAITQRSLSAEPQDRFEAAGAMADAITGYLAGVQERLRQAELLRVQAEIKASEERKRRKMQVAVIASLLLLVVVGSIGGWWAREQSIERERLQQAQREERIRQGERAQLTVDAALNQLVELQRRALWKQGESLLDQVDQQIGPEADSVLHDRLAAARTNLRFLAKLDQIRQEKSTIVEGGILGDRGNAKYADTFLEYGFDILNAPIPEVSQRLKDSPVCNELIAILYDWALDAPFQQSKRLDEITFAVNGVRWWTELPELATDHDAMRRRVDEVVRASATPALVPRLAFATSEQIRRWLWEAACRQYPNDFWLHYQRGLIFHSKKQYDRAVGAYEAALAVRPESQFLWNDLGHVLSDKQDLAGAIACCERAIELDPTFAMSHYNLGVIRYSMQDMRGALACYQKAIKLDPKFVRAHTNLGAVLDAMHDVPGAVASLKTAITLDPTHVSAHSNLGEVLSKTQDVEGAIACYKTAVALDPSDVHTARLRFLLRYKRVDEELTAVLAGKALPADAKHRVALAQICCLPHRRLHARAAQFYTEALAAEPGLALAHRYNAACCVALVAAGQAKDEPKLDDKGRAGFRQQALDWLRADLAQRRRLVEVDAKARPAVQNDLKHWQSDPDLVSVREEAAIAKLPADEQAAWRRFWADVAELLRWEEKLPPAAYVQRGIDLRAKGDLDGAIAQFGKAVKLEPDVAGHYDQLGWTLRLRGRLTEAEAECRRAIALQPSEGNLHNSLGMVLVDQKRFEQAEAAFQMAIAKNPKFVPFHENLGRSLVFKGDLDGASLVLNKAIDLDPKSARAHTLLGWVLDNKRDWDGAIGCYKRAIELDPKFVEPHNGIGWALHNKQDWDGAVDWYLTAIELDPTFSSARINLQNVLRDQRVDQELTAILAGKAQPKDAKHRCHLAEMCCRPHRRLYARALDFYREALAAGSKLDQMDRYAAARSVLLIAATPGKDEPNLDDNVRASLRQQALVWLRIDLVEWKLRIEADPEARSGVENALKLWQVESDLASVRETAAMSKLPADEQTAWRQLWADVASLLRPQERKAGAN